MIPPTPSSSSRSTCTSYWRACGSESSIALPSPCSATCEASSSSGTSAPCGGRSSYCRAGPVASWPGEAHRRGSLSGPPVSEEPKLSQLPVSGGMQAEGGFCRKNGLILQVTVLGLWNQLRGFPATCASGALGLTHGGVVHDHCGDQSGSCH